ncbi:MAG: zinc-dependent alcohol dehydrogenase family protein [Bacteroidota bacterium]
MRALRFHTTGRPAEVLRLDTLPDPEPGPGDVRVRLTHRPINPADLLEVRGRYGTAPDLPAVAGHEGVGVVDRLGAGVPEEALGQRVVPLDAGPTWQTHLVAHPRDLLAVPEGLPDEAAAQLFVNPLTAWLLVDQVGRQHRGVLPEGAWLVQSAGATTVGRLVVQLARHVGARSVSLVRRASDVALLERLGADAVIVVGDEFDGRAARAQIRAATGGASIRLGIDAVGGATGALVASALGEGGVLLSYGVLSGRPLPLDVGRVIFRRLTVRGVWRTRWFATAPRAVSQAALVHLADLIAQGVLTLPVAGTYDLAEIAGALAHQARPGRRGKVLLTLEQPRFAR